MWRFMSVNGTNDGAGARSCRRAGEPQQVVILTYSPIKTSWTASHACTQHHRTLCVHTHTPSQCPVHSCIMHRLLVLMTWNLNRSKNPTGKVHVCPTRRHLPTISPPNSIVSLHHHLFSASLLVDILRPPLLYHYHLSSVRHCIMFGSSNPRAQTSTAVRR